NEMADRISRELSYRPIGMSEVAVTIQELKMLSNNSPLHNVMSTELHCDHKSQLRSFAMSQPEEGTDEMKNLNESLREKSIRDSTRRQYETADGLYKEVCGYPVTGERLQIFIRALLSLESPQLTENTIAQYVSGVKTLSEIRGEDKLSPTEEQQ
ncbi:hypothetical protein FOL47_005342, partial [Perkinsus chesapeaki]